MHASRELVKYLAVVNIVTPNRKDLRDLESDLVTLPVSRSRRLDDLPGVG